MAQSKYQRKPDVQLKNDQSGGISIIEYLDRKFSDHEKVEANRFEYTKERLDKQDKLISTLEASMLQVGRIDDLYRSTCKNSDDIESINEVLMEYHFFIKYPKIILTGFAIFLFVLIIGWYREYFIIPDKQKNMSEVHSTK